MIPPVISSPSFGQRPTTLNGMNHSPPLWKRTTRAAKGALDKFENAVWRYFKECVKFTKCMLKVTVLVHSPLKDKVGRVIVYLGLLSAIKFLFQSKSLIDNIDDLIRAIKLKEVEGIVWSSLEMFFSPLEALSSLFSFAEALSKLRKIPWITLFSLVTLPLAIGLLCYNTLKSLAKFVYLAINFGSMPSTVTEETHDDLKKYLDKKVGVETEERKEIEKKVLRKFGIQNIKLNKENEPPSIKLSTNQKGHKPSSPSQSRRPQPNNILSKQINREISRKVRLLKDRKVNRLERQTDKKIVNIMRNLQTHLAEHPEDVVTSQKAVADMRKIMIRKIILSTVGTTFHVAECVMYVAAMVLPLTLWIPVAFSTTKSFFSLGKNGYNDFMMQRGLHLPQFIET